MQSERSVLIGLPITETYTKEQLVNDVQYMQGIYSQKKGINPTTMRITFATGMMIKKILGIVDNNLRSLCGMVPVYDDDLRNGVIFVGEGKK